MLLYYSYKNKMIYHFFKDLKKKRQCILNVWTFYYLLTCVWIYFLRGTDNQVLCPKKFSKVLWLLNPENWYKCVKNTPCFVFWLILFPINLTEINHFATEKHVFDHQHFDHLYTTGQVNLKLSNGFNLSL